MTSVSVSCLCGRTKATLRVACSIPAQSIACHKATCRHNLGALYHSLIPLEDRPETDSLSIYTADKNLSRFFCNICGSHLYQQSDQWYVQSGVIERIHLEQVSGTLEEIAGHRYVEQTLDGGIAECLSSIELTQVPRTAGQRLLVETNVPAHAGSADQHLTASCACGGVRFFVTRPDANSVVCSSPWPDLIVPYHLHPGQNSEDQKWWVRDVDKWLAGLCSCRSCRLGLSVPIQAWAFVARTNIFQLDGSPISFSMGELRYFESSPGTRREFCGRCGATVFWHNTERPGVVDVSVGLLQAEEGTLARTWLSWWIHRVSFTEDALDNSLITKVLERLETLL